MAQNKLLGRDGLATDETVSEYYTNGPYVVRVCWNRKSVTMPAQAIADLEASLKAVPNPEIDPSGIEAQRQYEIKKTIERIRAHYGLKEGDPSVTLRKA